MTSRSARTAGCLSMGLALSWVGCHAAPAVSGVSRGSPTLPSPASGAGSAGAPPAGGGGKASAAPLTGEATDVGTPRGEPPTKATPARVVFHEKSNPIVFDVELALDPASQERGLMFRKEVPPDTGMLFVFPTESPHVFWMKNTLVPLDMLFLSRSRKVVGIIENAEPLTLTPRDPHVPAQYVLEIAGGTAFARGIKVGDVADFENLP